MSGSDATVSGASVQDQWTGASGGQIAFDSFFNASSMVTLVSADGESTVTGAVDLVSANLTVTVSGDALADESAGGNNITLAAPATVFAAPGDTISASGAATLFGAGTGTTTFIYSGADSSVTGGTGGITGTSSGANSTLVGGSGINIFTVTGANSLAVAGPPGSTTGIDESGSTGPETIATNPAGGSGELVATLGSGADTVIGGGGESTINGGSGADVFGFVNGHAGGSEVINAFTTNDTFAFDGYGYSLANPPTETVVDGNDVITLSDQTPITLVGIGHKIF